MRQECAIEVYRYMHRISALHHAVQLESKKWSRNRKSFCHIEEVCIAGFHELNYFLISNQEVSRKEVRLAFFLASSHINIIVLKRIRKRR